MEKELSPAEKRVMDRLRRATDLVKNTLTFGGAGASPAQATVICKIYDELKEIDRQTNAHSG